ncbi:MAG: type I-E CRISPR-associated protein Cas7/Cse4/CasC, partial [Bradymonadaceae bacterium]
MSDSLFLQFHTLTSYPGTLLNRDDAGFAKRLPFGGATRTRVSSQCLKYHWRNHDGENALYDLDVGRSIRSRRTFNRKVADPLVDEGYPEPLVRGATLALQVRLLEGDKVTKTDVKSILQPDEDEDPLETNQVTIFGEPELRYIRELAAQRIEAVIDEFGELVEQPSEEWTNDQLQDIADEIRDFDKRELKKNLEGMRLAAGLDAAMFGRMATSDVLARGDAAVHVSHALTVHEEEAESDYFTAIDEIKQAETEEQGGGHLNSSELTSGLFYSYVVVDVPLLVSNIEGCPREEWNEANRELAAEVVDRFVKLITTVSPGAKLGSTAPYSYAQCLLAEAGSSQPRTLANAFQEPVPKDGELLQKTYEQLGG